MRLKPPIPGSSFKSASPLFFIVLVAALLLPVAIVATPPMIDVLGHMGRYELQTSLERHHFLQNFYSFNWQVIGNLGADLLVEALHPLLGVQGATKFAILLVPLITTCAILCLSRHFHGRITAFSVFALALIYGLPFTWGFLNFSLSMAFALLSFVLWVRLGSGWTRSAAFLVLSLGIWLSHTFGFAFLGILCTAESLSRRWATRTSFLDVFFGTFRDCCVLLAPLIPMILWRNSASEVGIDGWFDFHQKASWLISILRLEQETTDIVSAVILLAVIFACALHPRIKVAAPLVLAALIGVALYVLLPRQIFGSLFADMRFAPYVVMLALLSFQEASLKRKTRAVLMGGAVVFLGFRLMLTAQVYYERTEKLEAELGALSVIPQQARIATLVEIPCQNEWQLPWFSHIGSVALVRKHAFVNDQWANSSMNPLHVNYPAAGPYATDDRQLYFPRRCGMQPTFDAAFARLPKAAFTHIWVIGSNASTPPDTADLTPVWEGPAATVFKVNHPAPLKFNRISKLSKVQPY